ncbi:phosphatidylglycerophosphate synthase [Microbacterium sp. SORGH_AS 505]|nr:phosphatidylglycerophosphate synthase [Microbacterium sp. SORGH_AS_0505]
MTIPRQLPNAITIVRILCAPVFVWLLLADGGTDGALRWWAGALFIVAIATDGIDGYLAPPLRDRDRSRQAARPHR